MQNAGSPGQLFTCSLPSFLKLGTVFRVVGLVVVKEKPEGECSPSKAKVAGLSYIAQHQESVFCNCPPGPRGCHRLGFWRFEVSLCRPGGVLAIFSTLLASPFHSRHDFPIRGCRVCCKQLPGPSETKAEQKYQPPLVFPGLSAKQGIAFESQRKAR